MKIDQRTKEVTLTKAEYFKLVNSPVSEDLENALAEEWKGYNDRGAATVDALEDNTQELAFAKGFYRGAKWQEVKDQSTIELAEDHAMLAGMEKMKEEMMAKAVDGFVIEDIEEGNGDFLLSADYLPKSMGLKDQQRVKVIVIKEN